MLYGFQCPVCGKRLIKQEKQYQCPQKHSFDRSKSGYVNLLAPGSKHSKDPGDNKIMVNARREFLKEGYYAPLSSRLCQTVLQCLSQNSGRPAMVLDAGCGEGYYTGKLREALHEKAIPAEIFGVDISKSAVDKASKHVKEVDFAVASVFHLPVTDGCCDLLINLFAPFCREEIVRTLHPDGYFIMGIPGERHLWELKQAAYEHPYLNSIKGYDIEGLKLLRKESIEKMLSLPNQHIIDCLFKMTPYYYKTSREDQKKVEQLTQLQVTMQFELLIYQKA